MNKRFRVYQHCMENTLTASTRANLLAAAFVLLSAAMLPAAPADHQQARWRRPVKTLVDHERQQLLVANEQSGSISVIDLAEQRVTAEINVGKKLADLVALPGRSIVLAVDRGNDELFVLSYEGSGEMKTIARLKVSSTPVSVTISEDGRRCFVASLWSRRLTFVALHDAAKPMVTAVVELPFAPLLQRVLPDQKHLVVADAFAGRLAVVDIASQRLLHTREIDGHNLRGLGLSNDGNNLLVPHQILSDHATTGDGVHWGGVMRNVIRTVPVSWLLAKAATPSPAGDLYYLGFPDSATGDPTGILVSREGRQIIAYAGRSQLAISDVGVNYFTRADVGQRPVALAFSADESHVYAANKLSDSICVVEVASAKVLAEISLGPNPEATDVQRGEALFYDSRLSSDGWYSCHSCHTDGHSNGHLNDNFSDGTAGAPKRVLSLLGVADTGPWAWNGGVDSLDRQIHTSIELTMRGGRPTQQQTRALAAYLRTLPPPPSLARARGTLDEAAMTRGRGIFDEQGCIDCHAGPQFTSAGRYDVGLRDQAGNSRFNPPSLRGVSQRNRLFHDNRAKDVRDVLTNFKHSLSEELSPGELRDLIEYVNSL